MKKFNIRKSYLYIVGGLLLFILTSYFVRFKIIADSYYDEKRNYPNITLTDFLLLDRFGTTYGATADEEDNKRVEIKVQNYLNKHNHPKLMYTLNNIPYFIFYILYLIGIGLIVLGIKYKRNENMKY